MNDRFNIAIKIKKFIFMVDDLVINYPKKDYVIKDGEVIIVDEFTGRLMQGRRWSDGLHQAVEAKEGVPIQDETVWLTQDQMSELFDTARSSIA